MHKCQTNLQLEFTLWYFIWVLHLVPTNFIINISYVWFGPLFPPIHNISFHMLVISYHLVQRRNKNSKSKKICFKIKDTSQLQRLWIEMGNSNIFQTCKKFSKFKSLWIKKKNMWNQINYTYRLPSFISVLYVYPQILWWKFHESSIWEGKSFGSMHLSQFILIWW